MAATGNLDLFEVLQAVYHDEAFVPHGGRAGHQAVARWYKSHSALAHALADKLRDGRLAKDDLSTTQKVVTGLETQLADARSEITALREQVLRGEAELLAANALSTWQSNVITDLRGQVKRLCRAMHALHQTLRETGSEPQAFARLAAGIAIRDALENGEPLDSAMQIAADLDQFGRDDQHHPHLVSVVQPEREAHGASSSN